MGIISNIYELLIDNSFQAVEDESNKSLVIAIAGTGLEARDKLMNALSTRVESLWTTSPFRSIDIGYQPNLQEDEGGLLLYALQMGERIAPEQQTWLKDLAASEKVHVIVAVIPKQKVENNPTRKTNRRLQLIIPKRFLGGENTALNPSADGASSIKTGEVRSGWEIDLDQLPDEKGFLKVLHLSGLEMAQLEADLLPVIVQNLAGFELALARRAPLFRNAVAKHFINNAARNNAQTVLLSNVFAGVPFLAGFFGGGADFLLLTKNQFELSHKLAAIYGQKRGNRVEMYLELAPLILSSFLWRGVARIAIRRLPSLLAFVPKIGIAYAATLVVGRVAQWYYANGRVASAQLATMSRSLYERLTERFVKSASTATNQDTLNKKSS